MEQAGNRFSFHFDDTGSVEEAGCVKKVAGMNMNLKMHLKLASVRRKE